MPYRVDCDGAGADAFDRLVDLGAIDAEVAEDGTIAALMPDAVTRQQVARALRADDVEVSAARGRDAGSVWVLRPRPIRVGTHTLTLIDADAFGTGLHPTTTLCLEILEDAARHTPVDAVLDVGTGSGVLALAALLLGVPRATAVDIDDAALAVAAENARHNALSDRLQLARGGPEAVGGVWPLVLANVLAAPLIEMAPAIARRVGRHGRLVLSGIPLSVEQEVDRSYRHLGMQRIGRTSRAGWVALVLRATW